jgi:hypothetical protein
VKNGGFLGRVLGEAANNGCLFTGFSHLFFQKWLHHFFQVI